MQTMKQKSKIPWEWSGETNDQLVKQGNDISDELGMLSVVAKQFYAEDEEMNCFFYGLRSATARSAAAVLSLVKRLEEIVQRFPDVAKFEAGE